MTSMPPKPVFDRRARMQTRKPITVYQSEATVEKGIVSFLNALVGCCQFKHGVDGWPDRIVCYKGFFVGIEIKKSDPTTTATVRQQQRINMIRAAGGIGIVAHSVNDVIEVIKRIDDTVNDSTADTSRKSRTRPPLTRERQPDSTRERKPDSNKVRSPVRRKPRTTPDSRKPLDGQLTLV
jgi:hypothetical protein